MLVGSTTSRRPPQYEGGAMSDIYRMLQIFVQLLQHHDTPDEAVSIHKGSCETSRST